MSIAFHDIAECASPVEADSEKNQSAEIRTNVDKVVVTGQGDAASLDDDELELLKLCGEPDAKEPDAEEPDTEFKEEAPVIVEDFLHKPPNAETKTESKPEAKPEANEDTDSSTPEPTIAAIAQSPEREACPLCLSTLTISSLSTPSCTSCSYNVCSICIMKLHGSHSLTPSDVTCPSCQSASFGVHSKHVVVARSNLDNVDTPDEQLTASEIRYRYADWSSVNLKSRSYSEDMDGFVDTVVLRGLDSVMDAEEREYTYTLMTSGNVDDLIKGVVILHGIEGLVMNGKSFPTDSETAAGPSEPEVNTKTGWSTSAGGRDFKDIKEAVFGAFKVFKRPGHEKKASSLSQSSSMSDDDELKSPDFEGSPKSAPPARPFKDLPPPPLPTHMPFVVTLTTNEPKLGERIGLRNKLDTGIFVGKEGGGGRVERVYGQAARKGISRGDIVTHVEHQHPGNNQAVNELIAARLKEGGEVTLYINCNQLCADKLRYRAEEIELMRSLSC